MRSKYLISYTIDQSTNIIGYDTKEERNGAYRQYTETGILTVQSTNLRPDSICAHNTVACASYQTLQ